MAHGAAGREVGFGLQGWGPGVEVVLTSPLPSSSWKQGPGFGYLGTPLYRVCRAQGSGQDEVEAGGIPHAFQDNNSY